MSMTTGVEINLNASQLAQRVALVAEALDAMGAPRAILQASPYFGGSVQVQFVDEDVDAAPFAERFGLRHSAHMVSPDGHQHDSWRGTWADFTVSLLGVDPRRWVDPKASVFCDAEFGRVGDHAKWCGAKAVEDREAMAALQARRTERFAEEEGAAVSDGAIRRVLRDASWGAGEPHAAVTA